MDCNVIALQTTATPSTSTSATSQSPKKCLDRGFCPMHALLLHMFVNFEDFGHLVKMENLFIAVKLVIESYSLPTGVGIHGVLHKNNHGVNSCVFQEDATKKKAEKVR